MHCHEPAAAIAVGLGLTLAAALGEKRDDNEGCGSELAAAVQRVPD